jgi:molecular chaperone GrpE
MATNEPQAPTANADAETEQMRETEQKREEPRAEAIPGAEELLRQAELKAQEHHDAWLRAKAETENVRKRAQIEVANAHKYAIENFALELLPVKDSLEAALAAGTVTAEAILSGVEITLKQMNAVFEKANLKEIDPVGQRFDPHQHQAISMLPSDREPNTVINVLQKGYTLNDRVIRPALVTVSQPK